MHRLSVLTALSLVATSIAAAQTAASAGISIAIEEVPIVVTLSRGLNFGTVVKTGSTSQTADVYPTLANQAGETTALFLVTSQLNRSVRVSCPTSVTLAPQNIPSATALTMNTRIASVVGGQKRDETCPGFSNAGTFPSWQIEVGGTITNIDNALPGGYLGTFTITLAY